MDRTRTGPALAATAAAAALVIHASRAHPEIAQETTTLQRDLTGLVDDSTFREIEADLANLENTLQHALTLLESARDRGYRYQRDLDELARQAVDQWETLKPAVTTDVHRQAQAFWKRLDPLSVPIQRLNDSLADPAAAAPLVRDAQFRISGLSSDVQRLHRQLEDRYDDLEKLVYQLNQRLTEIHWSLEQLDAASFSLEKEENLVMAVQARLDQAGDDDPEGVLYLTNVRVLFERKEKVATKKVLFITTASELVQELVFHAPLADLKRVKASTKGLFGHQDFLEIELDAREPGILPFHLNGQTAEEWAALVERARSGRIEDERVSGSGLSMAELTGPLTASAIVALQAEVNELQDEMMLQDARAELVSLENEVGALERKLSDVRARGYAFESNLEADLAVLIAQWERIKAHANATLNHQTRLLGDQMGAIQESMAQFAGMAESLPAARPQYMRLKSAIASAEAQADAAEDTVLAQYDVYAEEVENLSAHLDWAAWMLDAISTASFRLLATEGGVAATEAVWSPPSGPPENGVLFLTDQRLVWENREETYAMKLAVPLGDIQQVEAQEDETGDEILTFAFAGEAPYRKARFRLALPVAESWLQMIGRARSGDYQRDRALAVDPAEIERVRSAPDRCPNCGASFTTPVLRGRMELTCEYCGVVTRL